MMGRFGNFATASIFCAASVVAVSVCVVVGCSQPIVLPSAVPTISTSALGIKLGLILYLVWAAPVLGRYRQPVLLVATAAGVVGALSNFVALPLFPGPGA